MPMLSRGRGSLARRCQTVSTQDYARCVLVDNKNMRWWLNIEINNINKKCNDLIDFLQIVEADHHMQHLS